VRLVEVVRVGRKKKRKNMIAIAIGQIQCRQAGGGGGALGGTGLSPGGGGVACLLMCSSLCCQYARCSKLAHPETGVSGHWSAH